MSIQAAQHGRIATRNAAIAVLLVCAVADTGVSGGTQVRAEAAGGRTGERGFRIVILDDSLCPACPEETQAGECYCRILEEMLEETYGTVDVKTIRAETGRDPSGHPSLLRPGAASSPLKPGTDLYLISCGLNESQNRYPADEFYDRLSAIVDTIEKQADTPIILMTTPPLVDHPRASLPYALQTKRIGLSRDIPVVDLYTSFMTLEGGWKQLYRDPVEPDAVYYQYPNSKGQELIAKQLFEAVTSLGVLE